MIQKYTDQEFDKVDLAMESMRDVEPECWKAPEILNNVENKPGEVTYRWAPSQDCKSQFFVTIDVLRQLPVIIELQHKVSVDLIESFKGPNIDSFFNAIRHLHFKNQKSEVIFGPSAKSVVEQERRRLD